jgi:hypothetical protein
MTRADRETVRVLRESLETVREMRLYWQPKAGQVHRVRVLLRKAGVPIPRPGREN